MKILIKHTVSLLTLSEKIILSLAILIMTTANGLAQQGDANKPITLTWETPWVIAGDQPEPVRRALEDVKLDWYKVFGRNPVILKELPAYWKGAAIYLGVKGDWRSAMIKKPFKGPESFFLRVQPDLENRKVIVATGEDARGSIYAAYTLSEEILGVDPWYYWVDKEPASKSSIQVPGDYNKSFNSPTFKYRGWFINDEDLLNRFAKDPMEENAFSLEMSDKIYETILRLKGNMIVPATFPFPDEKCQELAARRGLVINMHHILVAGLNTYRWPANVPFSYAKHPAIMEDYWKKCIDAFKDYEVVWTVGYRGKHDRPFWKDEPELQSPESRGEVITNAIAKQVELIRAVHPNADIISNLWDEGAEMYHKGFIRIPAGVTIVWPDNGAGIIRDQDNVLAWPGEHAETERGKQKVQKVQGIYYHTAMLNNHANQLSEMVDPGRIYREIGRFVNAGATSFFLVNVSDIRPVPLTTDCVMKLTWDASPYTGKTEAQNREAFLLEWCKSQFGAPVSKKLASAYGDYFNIAYMKDGSFKGENTLHTKMHRLHIKANQYLEKDTALSAETLKEVKDLLSFCDESHSYLLKLSANVKPLISQVPADRQKFFEGHLYTQVQVHLNSLLMLEEYCKALEQYQQGDKKKALVHATNSYRYSNELYDVLNRAEYGKWKGWYMGEGVVNIARTNYEAKKLIAQLKGEKILPFVGHEGYKDIEKYQEPFLQNFPLLYPGK